MTDLKNNLEEFLIEHKNVRITFNKNRDYTSLEKMIEYSKQLEQELLQAKKDVEFWKEEYVSHSETMCKCQQELQKTKQQLNKAEKVISADVGYNVFEFHKLREEYFKDKDKQGE